MEQGSERLEGNPSEGIDIAVSGVSQIASDFIASHLFARSKIKNGEAHCDRCGSAFPAIHPIFIIADDSSEELFCYLCNYNRLGIDINKVYRDKRSNEELEALKVHNQKIKELKSSRQAKKRKIKVYKKSKVSTIKTPDLFSDSTQ